MESFSSPMRPPAQAAWARVSILLNRGLVLEARAEALIASAKTRWTIDFDDYLQYGGPRVYDTHQLPIGWCWVEPDKYRVLVATPVHDEFTSDLGFTRFVRTVARAMDAPGFRRYEVSDWRELTSEL